MRLTMRRALAARSEPTRCAPEQRSGPFSYLVCALDGLPAARALRTALDEMWESPLLSRRAKALVFAVVARGLDCARGEREARALLEATGLAPDRDRADPDAPRLARARPDRGRDRAVRARHDPRSARRSCSSARARCASRCSPTQIVETVGVCALANAVCRLGVVTQLG